MFFKNLNRVTTLRERNSGRQASGARTNDTYLQFFLWIQLFIGIGSRNQSLNSAGRLPIFAIIASCRSFDINIAAFQVAMYFRPSATEWSRA